MLCIGFMDNDLPTTIFRQMHTLWTVTVDDGNGREIYGEGYADIWAISRLHLKGGVGTTGCDRVSRFCPWT